MITRRSRSPRATRWSARVPGSDLAARASGPASVHDRVLAVLGRHLSTINAQNVLSRAVRDARVGVAPLGADDLRKIQPALERGLRLFLPITTVAAVLAELARAFAPAEPLGPCVIEIRNEADIADARQAARNMCE